MKLALRLCSDQNRLDGVVESHGKVDI